MDDARDRAGVVRDKLSTADPDTAEEYLRRTYHYDRLTIAGPEKDFTFARSTVAAARFSLGRLRVGVPLVAEGVTRLDDALVVAQPAAGRVVYVNREDPEVHADTGGVVLVPSGGAQRVVCDRLDLTLLQFDRPAVAAYAAAVTGLAADDLAFEDAEPLPGRRRVWAGTVAFVRDVVLGNPWAAREPILLEQAFRSLSATLLSTFPNTALARADDPEGPAVRGDVSAATLRGVVEYLDTHADQPIGPYEIAALTGWPVNEIVAGLRRRYERHPASLLWRARLRGVRRDLVDADPEGVSVAGLAARWGFARVGRFRIAYVQTFGEWPEDTLRR